MRELKVITSGILSWCLLFASLSVATLVRDSFNPLSEQKASAAFNTTDWQKFTLSYTQFSDPGMSKTVTVFTLPQKQVIKDFLIKTGTAFTSSGGLTNVNWISLTHATASGNNVTKNAAGSNGTYDASAQTNETVASGNTYFRFNVAAGASSNVLAGLSHNAVTGSAPTFSNMDYVWFVNSSNMAQVFESGSGGASFSYTYGQDLQVEIAGTDVLWKINGVTKYTHTGAVPNYPQFGVAAMATNSTAQITNGQLLMGSATALLDFGNSIGGTQRYQAGYNLVPAPSATNFNAQSPFGSGALLDNLGAPMDLQATVRSSTALSSLTAGSVDIWFRTETLN